MSNYDKIEVFASGFCPVALVTGQGFVLPGNVKIWILLYSFNLVFFSKSKVDKVLKVKSQIRKQLIKRPLDVLTTTFKVNEMWKERSSKFDFDSLTFPEWKRNCWKETDKFDSDRLTFFTAKSVIVKE